MFKVLFNALRVKKIFGVPDKLCWSLIFFLITVQINHEHNRIAMCVYL
jgi:hypothetical protein